MADTTEQERWYAANITLRDSIVADVGANIGQLSQFFYDAGAHVTSIEPLAANVAQIEARIRRATNPERWRVDPRAVSATTGTLRAIVDHTEDGESNAIARADGDASFPCAPLDEVVPDVQVVKLDIEGHEYTVLDDALSRISTIHTWAVEFHMIPERPLQRALADFEDAGFSVVAATRDPAAPQVGWRNATVDRRLSWAHIPVAKTRGDGTAFKMLHIIAKRR